MTIYENHVKIAVSERIRSFFFRVWKYIFFRAYFLITNHHMIDKTNVICLIINVISLIENTFLIKKIIKEFQADAAVKPGIDYAREATFIPHPDDPMLGVVIVFRFSKNKKEYRALSMSRIRKMSVNSSRRCSYC